MKTSKSAIGKFAYYEHGGGRGPVNRDGRVHPGNPNHCSVQPVKKTVSNT